ncbi:MAG: glycosyltransferase family 39 protein [bacterium]|nr:glycosyltransferase family 39 protein [bacterium]
MRTQPAGPSDARPGSPAGEPGRRGAPRRVLVLVAAAVAAALATGVHDDRLFGPDEPREAEIARETLADGRWVTPHLCALPFLEKPPLYYDSVALAYAAAGRITAGVARSVSVLYALLMAAALFLFARRAAGTRAAVFSVLVLLTMPRLWRYAHTVLLDIAMGAFCVCALASFAGARARAGRERGGGSLVPFALFSAAAFLTKGFLALFNIAVVVTGFCAVARPRDCLRRLLSLAPLAAFLAPVAVWVALFAREGGVVYLHEHFVNNIAGRLLQIRFEHPGARFAHTDIGYALPWHFYLAALPEMFGVWAAALPIAVWAAARRLRAAAAGEREDLLFALSWAILPGLLLSFSPVKERTYILPSYAGVAFLAGWWLDGALRRRGETGWRGAGWLALVFPCAVFVLAGGGGDPRLFTAAAAAALALPAAALVVLAARRRLLEASFLGFALLLCVLMTSHAPNVVYRRWRTRCFSAFARDVWARAGDDPVVLYRPNDNARGSVPFYGNRTTPEINLPPELRAVAAAPGRTFVVIRECVYEDLRRDDPALAGMLHPVPMPVYESDPVFLLAPTREGRPGPPTGSR